MEKMKEKLLNILSENAQLTNEQLAVMIGSDVDFVKNTKKEFEKEGIIKGYNTLINWEKFGKQTASAIIELKVTPQRNTGFDEIAARIMEFPEVEFVYLMSGGFDLAVMVNAATMADVAMFVAKRLAPIGGILSTATHFVLTRYKDGGKVFVNDEEEIDERGSNLCD